MTTRITLLSLFTLTLGCAPMSGDVVDEFDDASDVPQPSDDLGDDQGDDEATGDDDGSSDNTGKDDDEDLDEEDEEEETEEAVTVDYGFDAETSLIYVQVFKDTSALGSALAHDHVVRADNFDGWVRYNVDDLSECEIGFILEVEDLRVDENAMRELVGYGDELSSSDRSEIRTHMLEPNQLDGDTYPTIEFASTRCSGAGGTDGTLTVEGGLTVRGRTAPVDVPVQFELRDGQFYAQTSFDMLHADFGMAPYSAFGGLFRNADPLSFTLDVVGFEN